MGVCAFGGIDFPIHSPAFLIVIQTEAEQQQQFLGCKIA